MSGQTIIGIIIICSVTHCTGASNRFTNPFTVTSYLKRRLNGGIKEIYCLKKNNNNYISLYLIFISI